MQNISYTIEPDDDPESPREWDNLGRIVTWRSRYSIGDDQPQQSPQEWREAFDAANPGAIILPVYLYDHGGLRVSTRPFPCPWDSGQIGWIYLTAEKAREEYGWKLLTAKRRAKLAEYLAGEVETLDQYLSGDVWGYVVKNAAGDVLDSCWGFYGHEECEAEAKAAAAYLTETHCNVVAECGV